MLETAVAAARLAGREAMEQFSFSKVTVKKDGELVTAADVRCQQIIIEHIKKKYHDDGFIAEEGQDGGLLKVPPRGSRQVWWIIDPIDGTNNYAHHLPLFAISIAAIHNGEPIAGAIFEPATESMFTAIKDGDAQLNGRRIEAGEERLNRFSSVALDSYFDEKIADWACEIIQKTKFRNIGSTALHLAYVAKGALAAGIFSHPKLWDIAAGSLIAEAAGAVVTDWSAKKIFPVNPDTYEGGRVTVIAANKNVHPQIVKLINESQGL